MKMKQVFTGAAAALCLTGMSMGVSAAGLDIDLFSTDQALQTDTTTGDGGLGNTVDTAGTDIIGGERDVFVELLTDGGNPFADAAAGVGGGAFSFSVAASATGTATIQWDGDDNAAGHNTDNLDFTGLGGADLSAFAAFEVNTLFSDLGYEFLIGAYTDATNFTVISFSASDTPVPATTFIPLGAFDNAGLCGAVNPAPGVNSVTCGAGNATVDWSNLGALVFVIDPNGGTTSVDLRLDSVRAVPEPSTLATFGLGLLALAGLRRRKSKA